MAREWLDQPLKGEWADHRECQIRGDFLLNYQRLGQRVIFVRTDEDSSPSRHRQAKPK